MAGESKALGEWVTNIHKDDDFTYKAYEGLIEGPPKATKFYTYEQMVADNYIGLYKDAEISVRDA